MLKQQHLSRKYDQIDYPNLRLSVIESKGYKIRAGLKKEEQHDGDDDFTFPSQKIFFP
ncbi:Hypothetical protein OINT_1001011 [Brucella intermedia LMG 3301]|uniref:Uncharacterized protein n=1 Tax=Brucella intermedia LMG 3301 TaxID=641118 RepID=C4WHH2_9HYPH|nr:Hypothetical protein OINT_1001011 [Brucella intermedia LMG 3301]ERI16332.1 hypothetical protein O206_00945 [Ochrobactrum sp. EGD-AQ16]